MLCRAHGRMRPWGQGPHESRDPRNFMAEASVPAILGHERSFIQVPAVSKLMKIKQKRRTALQNQRQCVQVSRKQIKSEQLRSSENR